MFDTTYSLVGVAIIVLITGFAFLKGDEPERIGAGAFVMVALASLLIQDSTGYFGPKYGQLAADLVLLAIFAIIAWKSRRTWPVWAAAFQGIIVASHLVFLMDTGAGDIAFYAVNNLSGFAILITLAVGTFWAWQERRAAGFR